MKYISVIVLFLSVVYCYSQECVYEVDNVDPRTDLRILRTEFQSLGRLNNNPFLVKTQSIGTKKYLKFRYYKYNNFEIVSDAEVEFFFSDNSSVNLKPFVNPRDSANASGGFMTVSSIIILPVDEISFEKLLVNPVVKIKYYRPDGYVYKEIKEKKQRIISDVLKCLE